MLLHNWLIMSLPVFNSAVNGASVWMTRAWTASSGELVRETGDFDVAKSVKGEGGLILFNSFSAQNEMIGGLGRSQVIDVHGAVRIQDFGETQLNVRSSGTFDADLRESRTDFGRNHRCRCRVWEK